MKFMNKKEQVLDIQLTPYGEHLLSQGLFKPEYYAFYDDNVLYESQYAGQTESQNEIEPRIQENTPQLETQAIFSGRDIYSSVSITGFGEAMGYGKIPLTLEQSARDLGITSYELQEYIAAGGVPLEGASIAEQTAYGLTLAAIDSTIFDRYNYGPIHNLGSSDRTKTNAPSWDIGFLHGEISNSFSALTGANSPTLNIPQINSTIKYTISVVDDIKFISDTELAVEFENGEFLDIKPDYILSQILEKNAEFSKENFSIEVFEVIRRDFNKNNLNETVETLRPLRFRKPVSLVKDDILLDPKDVFAPTVPITTDHVEYYFDVRVDNQIDDQIICASIDKLKSKGLHIDTEFVCEDIKNISLLDIYSTDAASAPCPDDDDDGGSGDICDDAPGTIFIPTISSAGSSTGGSGGAGGAGGGGGLPY